MIFYSFIRVLEVGPAQCVQTPKIRQDEYQGERRVQLDGLNRLSGSRSDLAGTMRSNPELGRMNTGEKEGFNQMDSGNMRKTHDAVLFLHSGVAGG